jgi:hypothetical protein
MSIPLSTLVDRLRVDVPPRDGVPSDDQYERFVKEAAADFGQKAGRSKISSVSVVTGTAAYDLPADFVRIIQMDNLSSDGRVINRGGGLIPYSGIYNESWEIINGQIIFYPTPVYTMLRYFEYQARWALDVNDDYTDMSEIEAGALMHLATALALMAQANIAAREAWNYQMGEARVSKDRLAAELREQAKQARVDYETALVSYNSRSVGMRATYSLDAYS